MKVRLHAIDAPERGQAFSNKSKQAMSDMVYKEKVRLECQHKPDRYNRRVCNVYVINSKLKPFDAGLELVKRGLAWNYPQFMKQLTPEQQKEYQQAEEYARTNKIGLWSDKNPTPPWEWRKNRR